MPRYVQLIAIIKYPVFCIAFNIYRLQSCLTAHGSKQLCIALTYPFAEFKCFFHRYIRDWFSFYERLYIILYVVGNPVIDGIGFLFFAAEPIAECVGDILIILAFGIDEANGSIHLGHSSHRATQ